MPALSVSKENVKNLKQSHKNLTYVTMDKSAADSYVYAKMSGMMAKSFVGERATHLFEVDSLSKLWTLVFNRESPPVPQNLLSRELEKEAQKEFFNQYIKLIKNYSHPSQILTTLLRFYEYDNLKTLSSALNEGFEEMPDLADISPFSQVNYSAWPNFQEITAKSPYEWYKAPVEFSVQRENDYKLDEQYIRELWTATKKTAPSCRKALEDLIGEKISIDNVIWALRLKIYYKMPDFEILNHLVYSTDENKNSCNPEDIFVKESAKILSWDVDDWTKWGKWKLSAILNPHQEGDVWILDPRWLNNAYKSFYVKKAYKMFHLYPFTECPLVCFFIVKRNELDNIRTAAESIRLNISSSQAMEIAGLKGE